MTQMAFALSVSLPLSLWGFAAVATEWRMRGGGIGCGEECGGAGDGTGKWEIGGVRTYWSCEAQLRSRCCVWFSVCLTDFALAVRRRNKKNVFLLHDWVEVCTLPLHLVCVLYDLDMLCVHSDYSCIILSPTTTSKIGHLRSGRVITLSALMESDQKDYKKK